LFALGRSSSIHSDYGRKMAMFKDYSQATPKSKSIGQLHSFSKKTVELKFHPFFF